MSATSAGEVVKEVGIFGLKTLIAMNAGAIVVMLGFTGSFVNGENSNVSLDFYMIRFALVAFLIGIAMALCATLATYVLAQMSASESPIFDLSFFGFLAWMIVPSALSFVFFVFGAFLAIFSFGAV